MKNKATPDLHIILLVALAYFAGARFGHLFSLVGKSVSLVWPAAGIALAAVLRYGNVAAVGILLAILAEEFLVAGMPFLWACCLAFSGTGAALLAAWGMQRHDTFHNDLRKMHDVRALLIWGVLIAPVFAAVTGLAALCMAHIAHWDGFWSGASYWAMGDALGVLLFTPLFLSITARDSWPVKWNPSYAGWLAMVAGACLLVFSDAGNSMLGFDIPPLILFPLMIWGAHLYALSALSLGLVLVFIGAFASYLTGVGHYASLFDQVSIEPWFMVSTLAVSGLAVSAGNAQRVAAEQLAASRKLHAWLSDSDRPLDDMLEPLCNEATEQIPHAACAILLFDTERARTLRLTAFSGDEGFKKALTSVLDAGSTPIHRCAAERKSIDVPDIQGRSEYALMQTALAAGRFSGFTCLPIEDGSVALGAICIFLPEHMHHWDRYDRQVAERIAYQSAVLITRRHDEQALRKRQEERETERALLRSLIDANPDLIFVKDMQGKYLLCNKAFEAYAERSEGAILGKVDQDLFGQQVGAVYQAQDTRVLQEKTSIHTEDWVLYSGRRRVLLDTLKSPLFDAQGNIRGVVGICRNITQHRELEQTFMSVTENHQRSIGQDLHDNLGQRLVAISYLAKALEQNLLAAENTLAKAASAIVEHTRDAVAECKQLAQGLVPVELESQGLIEALQGLASRTAATFGIACDFECEKEVRIHDAASILNLYRIAQEATNNAIRHGNATHIRISLSMQENGARLCVHDNGKGLSRRENVSSAAPGMGVKIMHYRASLIGAALQFMTPQTGGGTAVTVDIGYRTQTVSHGVDRRRNRGSK